MVRRGFTRILQSTAHTIKEFPHSLLQHDSAWTQISFWGHQDQCTWRDTSSQTLYPSRNTGGLNLSIHRKYQQKDRASPALVKEELLRHTILVLSSKVDHVKGDRLWMDRVLEIDGNRWNLDDTSSFIRTGHWRVTKAEGADKRSLARHAVPQHNKLKPMQLTAPRFF